MNRLIAFNYLFSCNINLNSKRRFVLSYDYTGAPRSNRFVYPSAAVYKRLVQIIKKEMNYNLQFLDNE